ncbi:MAG: ferredoxin [Mycobacteriales bacterium]
MKIHVDLDVCEGHGQCEFAAPEVFAVNDEGAVDFEASPDEPHRPAVVKAVRLCPVQAIRVLE